uniref:Uncharacterized protein n=1 Tax=Strigamia maritima TaxID=126957 RepID=T1JBH6_STRMM
MDLTTVIIAVLMILAVVSWKICSKPTNFLLPDKKVVLVTGCDSGIGLGTAVHLHHLGFHVFAGCRQIGSEGALKLQNINSERLVPIQIDITNQTEIDAAVEKLKVYCEKNNCHFWSLINNAGVCIAGRVEWLTWEQIEKQVNVNVLGLMRMIRAFVPMLKLTKGRIINVGSISARWPYPKFGPYVGTKAAIEALSQVLRVDLATSEIKVIVVAPGNHCRITKLFENQLEYAQQQWDSFAPELRKELEGKFWNLQNNIIDFSRISCPDTFENSAIERDMQLAVMAVSPKQYYLSSTLLLEIMMYFYEWMPAELRTYLMVLFDSYSVREKKDLPFILKM